MDLSSVRSAPNQSQSPIIQLVPLVDVLFLLLIFYLAMSVYFQLESEMNVTVPVAENTSEMKRTPGEIIINIRKDGTIVVNQRQLGYDELKDLLVRIAGLYKGQPVIIRADQDTAHKYVIKVLDLCAGANIWNVSFATMQEEEVVKQ